MSLESIAPPSSRKPKRLGVYRSAPAPQARARVTVQNGKIESVGSSEMGGHRFQVFTPSGHTALGFTDGFEERRPSGLRRTAASAERRRRSVGPDRAIFEAALSLCICRSARRSVRRRSRRAALRRLPGGARGDARLSTETRVTFQTT